MTATPVQGDLQQALDLLCGLAERVDPPEPDSESDA